MAFKLQDFRSAVRDLARSYQFEVEILFPSVVGDSSLVNILATSTSLPKKKYNAVQANFMGQPHFLAGAQEYDDWNCQFRIDDNLDVYKRLRAWSEVLVGTESNIAAFPNAYKSNINLYQLDVAGNRLVSFTLNGAWLSVIGDITHDAKEHSPQTVDCTWAYDFYTFKVL